MRIHTEGAMTFVTEIKHIKSSYQNFNTKIPTEVELVVIIDYSQYNI